MKKDEYVRERLGDRSENERAEKLAWEKPKLEFVEPKLTEHGQLERLTGAFFGTFSP